MQRTRGRGKQPTSTVLVSEDEPLDPQHDKNAQVGELPRRAKPAGKLYMKELFSTKTLLSPTAEAPWVPANTCRRNTYSGREGEAKGQLAQIRSQKLSRPAHNVTRMRRSAESHDEPSLPANYDEGTLLQKRISATWQRSLRSQQICAGVTHTADGRARQSAD